MAKVKICGLMRIEDVQYVNEFRPDYAGLIFAPSKRRLSIDTAKMLCEVLDKDIMRVGVFVNEKPDVINQVRTECGLDVLQIYQDDNIVDEKLGGEIWLGIRVKETGDLSVMETVKANAYLLDAYNKDAYGGTGETFNWQIARQAASKAKIVLAGGLTPQNVREAIRTVNPYAVDVSSGVETGGIKDAAKIKEFIENARSI